MDEKLNAYRKKRDFSKTNEPEGKVGRGKKRGLRFCVQRHIARREHYDLRLEYGGVALSWAVPKGPSFDTSDKRLAVKVEDHPVGYMQFEGAIPKGEYGGGTVMLWDEGDYAPKTNFKKGLDEGSLKFTLFGTRLKGDWALVRMKNGEDGNAWLLIKEKDEYAKKSAGIAAFKAGVRSGKRMEEIKRDSLKNPFSSLSPMLACLTEELPKGKGWLFELKYDGHRTIAFCEGGKCRLLTRNGIDRTVRYLAVAEAVEKMCAGRAAVLDGEMVAVGEDGLPDFSALASYGRGGSDAKLNFVLFDLLALDGEDLRDRPLTERKKKLKALMKDAPPVLAYSEHTDRMTEKGLREIRKKGMEGIVCKRADSPYAAGKRGDWLKLKFRGSEEFVIGGFLKSETGELKSLLVGRYEGARLVFAGSVGTGFDGKTRELLKQKLSEIGTDAPPFVLPAKYRKNAVFSEPVLVVQAEYAEMTPSGVLRQASFKGLREDKTAGEVVKEKPLPSKRQRSFSVFGITHPEKLMFEEKRITKGEMAAYYGAAAERMLPYLKDRALSLVCCPSGVGGETFFRRHLSGDFAGVKEIPSEDKEPYFCVTGACGILSLVQYNAVEFHMRGAKGKGSDIMVFDLDPDEEVPLRRIKQGARDVREILKELGLISFLKTSGGKGYHIVVPLSRGVDGESFRDFSRKVAQILVHEHPALYTASISKEARKGKIFVDWQRNSPGATFAAPYSLRARESAAVSMPISWEALSRTAPDGITLSSALRRLSASDPWEDFFTVKRTQRLKR